MATIREISKKANVSIATVSKVLNGKSGVNEDTRNAILSIANELNYHPNLNARNLKTGRTKTLGIITEDLTVFNTPEIVDGIAVACNDQGYHYILENLRFNKQYHNISVTPSELTELIDQAIHDLLSRQIDGIIYIGCHSHVIPPLSAQTGIKFVCAYCLSANPDIPSVTYDDAKAAYDVTELLISDGNTKIGIISGPIDSIHTANRTKGYQEALFHHGISFNPALAYVGDWSRASGYEHAKKLIDAGVTAIFAYNDLMALGVLDYCNEHGIQVGSDFKVMGFDNRDISNVCRPTLSTVALPLFEIGQNAAKLMFDQISEAKENLPNEVQLECNIIERESTDFKIPSHS